MPSPRKKTTPAATGTDPKPVKKTARKATPAAAPKATGVEPAAARRKRAPAKPKVTVGIVDRPPLIPDGSGNYDLVIVESPAKAKTINKYLGQRFKVLASYGHVRDLATGRRQPGEEVSGIKISDGWKLRYLVDAGAKAQKRKGRRTQQDILDELRAAAAKATRVLLASDPDREGESIAWHIADELKLDPAQTYRIRFNEITKNAVQHALAQADKIDMERVRAQEARRAMDRVVGFPLSGLLGDKVTRGLSAGRVQSVAVKLIVDREREIEAFRTEEYWKITALLAPQGSGVKWTADLKKSKIFAKKKGEAADKSAPADDDKPDAAEAAEVAETPAEGDAPAAPAEKAGIPNPPAGTFLAELAKWDGADAALKSEADADRVTAALLGSAYVVSKIDQKDRPERPSGPFTTSTLQQQANIRLRFSASRTMQTAQKLYEGVDLGSEGNVALITYMRTDSMRISPDALNNVRAHIQSAFGKPYLPEKPNVYAAGKSAQEAHECVRPTDVAMTPERAARAGLGGDQLRLYTLIYQRFVASQMTPAIFAVTNVEVTAGPGLFKATGRILKFDGYRKVMSPAGKQEDTELPALRDRMPLDRLDLFETQHFTQPPSRFNEASLVKMLEKEGIGRPSTYASIIETIQARGYVRQEARRFFATDVGKVVTDLLVAHFPRIMDLKFTSHFEEELDDIETGKCQYRQVLDEFWGPFSEALKKAETDMPALRGIETGEKCPQCGRPLLQLFSAKTGKPFIGCSGYREDPKCTYIQPGEGETPRAQPTVTDIPCPACGKWMVKKEGRFGTFFTCEGAPGCPTTMNLNAEGKVVVTALPTTHQCPKCEKHNLLLKESKAGKKYLGCPDPKCKYMVDSDAQGNPVKPAETGVACEKCGSPMVIRTSWRGPFLSCSGYPRCRNAKSINAELREKLKDILPPMPEKAEKAKAAQPDMPAVEITDKCPECDSPMRLQKSRFGGRYFLGCTKYPKCKGTKKPTPALLEQIAAAEAPAAGG
ncbi:type I DNA topoisomerase [Fimbriiglobus ruber]|uniref:DNA topoisomerase 1 n=1 Tax=Fimbriiglobus ruber TaxID=1908690 RepID=A0A225D362_9BACT|nr:type I DNA topoisomerase [Fimbriiglobus ruber]OWK35942.1 DNA topoisomerase I [Fimbriiglobus ruber]